MIAGIESLNKADLGSAGQRVIEVDLFLQESRRHWMLGVVAVNLAVKSAGFTASI